MTWKKPPYFMHKSFVWFPKQNADSTTTKLSQNILPARNVIRLDAHEDALGGRWCHRSLRADLATGYHRDA
jgi:hypothetical protein